MTMTETEAKRDNRSPSLKSRCDLVRTGDRSHYAHKGYFADTHDVEGGDSLFPHEQSRYLAHNGLVNAAHGGATEF